MATPTVLLSDLKLHDNFNYCSSKLIYNAQCWVRMIFFIKVNWASQKHVYLTSSRPTQHFKWFKVVIKKHSRKRKQVFGQVTSPAQHVTSARIILFLFTLAVIRLELKYTRSSRYYVAACMQDRETLFAMSPKTGGVNNGLLFHSLM